MKQILILLAGITIGGFATFGAMHFFSAPKSIAAQVAERNNAGTLGLNLRDQSFMDDFFSNENPFESMREMQKRMEEQFSAFSMGTPGASLRDDWFDISGQNSEIVKKEDSKFVYYEIDLKGKEVKDFRTDVKDGQLTILAEIAENSAREDSSGFSSRRFFSSSFRQSFPLPPGVDETGMEISHDDGKLVVKFPKQRETAAI